jgi:prolyl oligopeptidase
MSLIASMHDTVVDTLHGVNVYDHYRWLEERNLPDTERWISDQKRNHAKYFAAIPSIDSLRARIYEYLDVEITDQPVRIRERYFYRRRGKGQQQASIYVRDIAPEQERLLVDPSIHGDFASASIHHISRDGSLLAYELKEGGSDATTIHILNVQTGAMLPDHLQAGIPRGFVFAPDSSGFYYCHDSVSLSEEHTVKFHRFGDPGDINRVLLRMRRTPRSRLLLKGDPIHLGATYFHEDHADLRVNLYLTRLDNDSQWTLVFADRQTPSLPFLIQGRVFILTRANNGGKTIIELEKDGTGSHTIVPAGEKTIDQVVLVGTEFCVSYRTDGKTAIRRWPIDGRIVSTIDLPSDGSVDLLSTPSGNATSLFLLYESFGSPPSIVEYDTISARSTIWSTRSTPCQAHPHRLLQTQYPSVGDTDIPLSLVMRSDLGSDSPHPAIMTSYGGFGATMTPRFSAFIMIMVELGAVVALPNIRGNSQPGRDWHTPAQGTKRQVAFDDFIKAAEWLCEHGITSSRQLGILGGSNAGLLVGAVMTQRPDLFGAILCIAPLLDMVRYERFDQARKWQGEFGTAEDADQFQALYAYSPYHHVRSETNYPSTLLVTGDKDDRCNPAHVRKMAAQLQSRASQTNPILVDYSPMRGHSPTLPLSVRVEALTQRIAFFCRELGIAFHPETHL